MPKKTKTGRWSLEDIAIQAVVLYEGCRKEADEKEDVQSEMFWRSHRNNVVYALRGTETPITEDEVEKLMEQWAQR